MKHFPLYLREDNLNFELLLINVRFIGIVGNGVPAVDLRHNLKENVLLLKVKILFFAVVGLMKIFVVASKRKYSVNITLYYRYNTLSLIHIVYLHKCNYINSDGSEKIYVRCIRQV